MLRQCCECKKIWANDQWVYPRLSQLEGQDVSHGYCDECHSKKLAAIRRKRAQKHNNFQEWVSKIFHSHD